MMLDEGCKAGEMRKEEDEDDDGDTDRGEPPPHPPQSPQPDASSSSICKSLSSALTFNALSSPKPKNKRRARSRKSTAPPPQPRTNNVVYFEELYNDFGKSRPSSSLLISDNHPTHYCEKWNEPVGLPPLDRYYQPLDSYMHNLLTTHGVKPEDTTIVVDDPIKEDLGSSIASLELSMLEELRDSIVERRKASRNHTYSQEEGDEAEDLNKSIRDGFSGQDEKPKSSIKADESSKMIAFEESYRSVDISKQNLPPQQETSPTSIMDLFEKT